MSTSAATWESIRSAPEYREAVSIIASEAARLAAALPPELSGAVRERYLARVARCRDLDSEDRLRRALAPLDRDIASRFSTEHLDRFHRLIVASLALKLEGKHPRRHITPGVLSLYPDRMARLASYLTGPFGETRLENDLDYMRDLRFVTGFSVPVLSNEMDLVSRISAASLVKCLARPDSRQGALRLLRSWSLKPWFRTHVDRRHLTYYNAPGKIQSFLMIADMLRCNPSVLGCTGTGWTTDPHLERISPRLSFLRSIPLAGGAFQLRHGTSEVTVQRALFKSPTRRRLYEAGQYMPTNYSQVWLRADLIAWADARLARGATADE
jgi:hypothetical protein